jgi:hypothetical protein
MYATLESPVECEHVCWDQCDVDMEVQGVEVKVVST